MVTGMTAGNPRGTGNRDPSDVFIRRVFCFEIQPRPRIDFFAAKRSFFN
jgi:hypothetical protein